MEKEQIINKDGAAECCGDVCTLCGPICMHDFWHPRTYDISYSVMAAEHLLADACTQSKVKQANFWDTASPYHYVRLVDAKGARAEDAVLIVGGEDPIKQKSQYTELYHTTNQ